VSVGETRDMYDTRYTTAGRLFRIRFRSTSRQFARGQEDPPVLAAPYHPVVRPRAREEVGRNNFTDESWNRWASCRPCRLAYKSRIRNAPDWFRTPRGGGWGRSRTRSFGVRFRVFESGWPCFSGVAFVFLHTFRTIVPAYIDVWNTSNSYTTRIFNIYIYIFRRRTSVVITFLSRTYY